MPNPHVLPPYRGSTKHKNRPTGEAKGTLCPEWTHKTPQAGFATDPYQHPWSETKAQDMFAAAEIDPLSKRRYFTDKGIAFEARATNDGTWHGYPIPWENVPTPFRLKWLKAGVVSKKDIQDHMRFDKSDIHWAMATDGK